MFCEYPVLFVEIWWKSVIDIKQFYQLFRWMRLKQMNIRKLNWFEVFSFSFWCFPFLTSRPVLCDLLVKFRSYFYPPVFSCQWERQERWESQIIFTLRLPPSFESSVSFYFELLFCKNTLKPRTSAASFMNGKELLFMDSRVFFFYCESYYLCILNTN